jgi:hypothetical protein
MSSQSRQQRRAYEKWLKNSDQIKYNEWKSGSFTRGNKIHQDNEEKISQLESEYYEKIQTNLIQTLRAEGKSNTEIDSYIEDWVKTIRVWGSDERAKSLKEVKREKNLINESIESND